jgi:Lipopolysaccharide-assembly
MRLLNRSMLAALLTACAFGFSGGGFPPGIRTVAILPFENQTTEPTLAQEVQTAVTQAVVNRLGLRTVAEKQADAVVHGTITRYDPDQPAAYHGAAGTGGSANQVVVTRRQVQLTVDVEIVDQKTGNVILSAKGMSVTGDYDPGRENDGRKKALDVLADKLVTEAHSHW